MARRSCLPGLRRGGRRLAGAVILSGVAVWIGQLLLTCSNFKFSVGDSLELSGIQFTPPKRTRHRQDNFVVSGVAVWISLKGTDGVAWSVCVCLSVCASAGTWVTTMSPMASVGNNWLDVGCDSCHQQRQRPEGNIIIVVNIVNFCNEWSHNLKTKLAVAPECRIFTSTWRQTPENHCRGYLLPVPPNPNTNSALSNPVLIPNASPNP